MAYYEEDTNQIDAYNYSATATSYYTTSNKQTRTEATGGYDTNGYINYDQYNHQDNNASYGDASGQTVTGTQDSESHSYSSSSGQQHDSHPTLYYESGNRTEFSYTDSSSAFGNSSSTMDYGYNDAHTNVEYPSYSFTLPENHGGRSSGGDKPKNNQSRIRAAANIVE